MGIGLFVSTQATFKGWTDIMYAAVDSQSKVKKKKKVIKNCDVIYLTIFLSEFQIEK